MIDSDSRRISTDSHASSIELRGIADGFGFASTAGHTAAPTRSTAALMPTRILICRPNGRLGNTLLLTPLVQELERLLPGAEIDIVSACPAAPEIFREFVSVRTIHLLPRLGARQPLSVIARFLAAAQTRYDLVIDPCPLSWSSRFWTRAMHARADKLGFQSRRKAANVNFSVPIDGAPAHMAQYPVYLLRQALNAVACEMPPLSIKLTMAEKDSGAQLLRNILRSNVLDKPVIGLFLNATGTKRLPASFWRQLARRIQHELPEAKLVEIVPAHGERHVPELPGYFSTSIRRMASVINALTWFISADCGVMHLSAATDAATLGLFKVTDSAKYAPYGGKSVAVHVDDSNQKKIVERIAQHIKADLTTRQQAAV